MPLLDHFQPPLIPQRSWESFHARWINSIGELLNQILPARYFAELQSHLGSRVEADVAEFESEEAGAGESANGSGGVAVQPWAPPAATMTLPASFPDVFEVQVLDQRDGARLVGVVELVSPGNKDRPEARRAFAAKCAAYLQRGVGLACLDIVTSRQANLHDELVDLLGHGTQAHMAGGPALYAAAYRPTRRGEDNLLDVWAYPLAVGSALPTLPLALKGDGVYPLDLEATYSQARTRSRL